VVLQFPAVQGKINAIGAEEIEEVLAVLTGRPGEHGIDDLVIVVERPVS
jgi:hypothetical protein